jgi:hypothetical protein
MISGLPIIHGDRVVGVFLRGGIINGMNADGGSYATDFWEPVGLPIQGKYDDYGRIEDIQSGFERTLERILEGVCASEHIDPDNSCHQFTMPTTIDELVGQVERGYAGFKHGKVWQLGLALIRQEVWDYVRDAGAEYREYGDEPNLVRQRKWIEQDIKSEVEIREEVQAESGLNDETRAILKQYAIRNAARRVLNGGHWVCPDELDLDEAMELAAVNLYLDVLRKKWDVPNGRGSQNSDFNEHARFADFVSVTSRARQAEWDEE